VRTGLLEGLNLLILGSKNLLRNWYFTGCLAMYLNALKKKTNLSFPHGWSVHIIKMGFWAVVHIPEGGTLDLVS